MMLVRTVAAVVVAAVVSPAWGMDEATRERGEAIAARAIEYLRSQQDGATGGWSVRAEGPQLPAISSLVLTGMLMQPGVDHTDEAVSRGVEFVLSFRQDNGGIYDRILASYNTAISLSMLARVDTPEAKGAIPDAQRFLKGLQWSEDAAAGRADVRRVGRDHPFYGGVGYGGSSRPDNSNLNLMLQGLRDSGVEATDEAFQRALVFLQRTQMLDGVNDMPYAEGSTQGGFIYATSPTGAQLGVGESKAGTIEETLSDGTVASRLRAYGSMTYAGFKSYVYADLARDDPRVTAALGWMRENYTLEENPGIGYDGYYYYVLTFGRALDAWGEDELEVAGPDGSGVETRDWRADLIDRLGELQDEDGSFRSLDDRWMESNTVLITAYALISLQHALR